MIVHGYVSLPEGKSKHGTTFFFRFKNLLSAPGPAKPTVGDETCVDVGCCGNSVATGEPCGGFQLGKWGYSQQLDGFCVRENPHLKWMMTGGTPMTKRKPPVKFCRSLPRLLDLNEGIRNHLK